MLLDGYKDEIGEERLTMSQLADLEKAIMKDVEKETARKHVGANALNFGCSHHTVSFVNGFSKIYGGVQDASCANQR